MIGRILQDFGPFFVFMFLMLLCGIVAPYDQAKILNPRKRSPRVLGNEVPDWIIKKGDDYYDRETGKKLKVRKVNLKELIDKHPKK